MVRTSVIVCACSALLTGAFGSAAQEKAFAQGDKLINGQIGLGVIGVTGKSSQMMVPPMIAGFEFGFTDFLSAGLSAGMAGFRDEVSEEDCYFNNKLFLLAGRLNFHFLGLPGVDASPVKSQLDPYAGILAGWDFVRAQQDFPPQFSYNIIEASGYQVMKDRLQWGAYVGIRYYLMKYVGIFCEAGASFGFFSIGLTAKF
jgi:hypothetical protein